MSGPAVVVVVGSLNADVTIDVAALPSPGDTVFGRRRAGLGFGGKGANQAAAAAGALGASGGPGGGGPGGVAMIGCVGDDEAGRLMRDDLAGRGVDVSGIRTVPGPSGQATIAVDADGQNFIIVDPGANAVLTVADATTAAVRDAAVLLVQLEIPDPVVLAALRAAGGRVLLNPAPARDIAALVPHADLILPNRGELAALTGNAPALPGDRAEVVRQARLLGPVTVVVTLGEDGALIVDGDGRDTHVPAEKVEVVDTTGAGDCFCGVLAVRLAEGADLADATAAAVRAASLSVTRPGARG